MSFRNLLTFLKSPNYLNSLLQVQKENILNRNIFTIMKNNYNGNHETGISSFLTQDGSKLFKLPRFQNLPFNLKSIHTIIHGSGGIARSILIPTQANLTLPSSGTSRSKIRDHFPRPSEIKRIKRHGWRKRMSTKAGREVIMRRILKGRHCITH